MILADNTVGVGPWAFDVGPFAILIAIAVIAVVVYYVRKDRRR